MYQLHTQQQQQHLQFDFSTYQFAPSPAVLVGEAILLSPPNSTWLCGAELVQDVPAAIVLCIALLLVITMATWLWDPSQSDDSAVDEAAHQCSHRQLTLLHRCFEQQLPSGAWRPRPLTSILPSLAELEHTIATRDAPQLLPEDRDSVLQVVRDLTVVAPILFAGWESLQQTFPGICFERAHEFRGAVVPDMLHRIFVHCSDAMDVRIHIFDNASETYVHDHSRHFMSVALSGTYEHKIWAVDGGSDSDACHVQDQHHHYVFERMRGNVFSVPHEESGALVERCSYQFGPGTSYYIDAEELHTVTTQRSELGSAAVRDFDSKVITIVFRGLHQGRPHTLVRHPVPSLDGFPSDRVQDQPVVDGDTLSIARSALGGRFHGSIGSDSPLHVHHVHAGEEAGAAEQHMSLIQHL